MVPSADIPRSVPRKPGAGAYLPPVIGVWGRASLRNTRTGPCCAGGTFPQVTQPETPTHPGWPCGYWEWRPQARLGEELEGKVLVTATQQGLINLL